MMKRATLADAAESIEAAIGVLQDILSEETVDYFTSERDERTERAGRRMLEIGPLLYDKPRDCLQISLWETLPVLHHEVRGDEEKLFALFRPEGLRLAVGVRDDTSWEELRAAVVAMGNGPHLVH